MPLNLKSTSGGGITVTVPATNGTLVTAESLSAGSGASLVGYLQAGTGAIATCEVTFQYSYFKIKIKS